MVEGATFYPVRLRHEHRDNPGNTNHNRKLNQTTKLIVSRDLDQSRNHIRAKIGQSVKTVALMTAQAISL